MFEIFLALILSRLRFQAKHDPSTTLLPGSRPSKLTNIIDPLWSPTGVYDDDLLLCAPLQGSLHDRFAVTGGSTSDWPVKCVTLVAMSVNNKISVGDNTMGSIRAPTYRTFLCIPSELDARLDREWDTL